MKTSGQCPKCQKRNLFHSPCVMDRGDGNAAMCLSVGRTDAIEAREVGQFEVYVCRSCGFSEFYVIDTHGLDDHQP